MRKIKDYSVTHSSRGKKQRVILLGWSEDSQKENYLRLVVRDEQQPARKGGKTLQSEGIACSRVRKPERVTLERARKKRLGFMENMDYRKDELGR